MNKDELLQDKIFKANSNDRAKHTKKLIDELKPPSDAISKLLTMVQTIKGDKGDDGTTPTPEELTALIQPLIPEPIVGPKGDSIVGPPGRDGKDSTVPGPSGKDGIDGQSIVGPPGKDGSPDTPEQIAEKLKTLKDAWLEVKAIKGLDNLLQDVGSGFLEQAKGFVPRSLSALYDVSIKDITNGQVLSWDSVLRKWTPATVSATTTTTNFVENEIVAGSGTTFTLANTPILGSERIFAIGQRLTGGGVDYTISGAVITTINSWSAGDILADYRK